MPTTNELRTILLLSGIQFVNILDFMMVVPLGPDLGAIGISGVEVGVVVGAYTAAAAVSALAGSLFLDRFDRRRAVLVLLFGLAVATLAGAFARGLGSMIATRVLAGACGGPLTALTLAIIADTIPVERRGRAVAAVMSAFTVAGVLGVPIGLELARLWSWQAPFVLVSGFVLVAAFGASRLPSLRDHLVGGAPPSIDLSFLRSRLAIGALLFVGLPFFSTFLVLPSFSPYIQFNLDFPREYLGVLYMGGGLVTFCSVLLAGRVVDRFGATSAITIASVVFITGVTTGLVFDPPLLPVPVFVILAYAAIGLRMVPVNAVITQIPRPAERARYMSIAAAMQHLTTTLGAVVGAAMLGEHADHSLAGMDRVALIAVAIAVTLPVGLALVEASIKRVAAQRGASPPGA